MIFSNQVSESRRKDEGGRFANVRSDERMGGGKKKIRKISMTRTNAIVCSRPSVCIRIFVCLCPVCGLFDLVCFLICFAMSENVGRHGFQLLFYFIFVNDTHAHTHTPDDASRFGKGFSSEIVQGRIRKNVGCCFTGSFESNGSLTI